MPFFVSEQIFRAYRTTKSFGRRRLNRLLGTLSDMLNTRNSEMSTEFKNLVPFYLTQAVFFFTVTESWGILVKDAPLL